MNGATSKALDSVFDALSGDVGKTSDIIDSKSAPAQIGRSVFQGDLEHLKVLGAHKPSLIFGQKEGQSPNNDACSLPVNYGSRKSVSHAGDTMPEDTRLRMLNLKKMVNNLEIIAAKTFPHQHITPAMYESVPYYKQTLAPMLKAFSISDFSTWIPTVNSRFYFEEYQLPFILADQFDQMPMDSASVNVPGDIGHLEGFEETDVATYTSQFTTQDNYQVVSRNNVVHAQITEDLQQDSAPAYLEKLRRDVLMGIARSYEKCLANGDITGSPRGSSHMDSDIAALAANATFSKAFNGMRKKALAADALVGAGSFVYAHGDLPSKVLFEKVLKLMGKFASEKDDLMWVLPSSIENALVTGAIPELFTAFAFGSLASNVTGQVPPVFGIKCVTSQFMREDLNAAGVYQAGQTSTSLILIKKSRFMNFVRQAIRVWAAPSLPSSDILLMTAKMRHSWAGNNQSAAEKSVVMGSNIATL